MSVCLFVICWFSLWVVVLFLFLGVVFFWGGCCFLLKFCVLLFWGYRFVVFVCFVCLCVCLFLLLFVIVVVFKL